jgi:N-acyl-D-aspartate/D-glutamate deacylase
MTHKFDLVIRNGLVVDGSGNAPFEADVAISGSKIALVGTVAESGAEEIDARDCIVTPGFIDLHTHLDGHVTWESRLKPCSGHGITTAILGNCGVGFAPVRPHDQDTVIKVMEGVEDIPYEVLKAGLPWGWESFPEYLDLLSTRRYDMDIGTLLPHSILRTYVMGERALSGGKADAADISEMAKLTREALEAGCLGFGSSRLTEQRTGDGRQIPSLAALEDELGGIASAMGAANRGVLQMAFEFNDFPGALEEMEMLVRLARTSGRPTMYSLKQSNRYPEGWRDLLAINARANVEGIPIRPQVLGRPTGAIIGLECTMHPFVNCPSYKEISGLSLARRVVEMRKPDVRARLLQEVAGSRMSSRSQGMTNVFEFNEPLDYEPLPSQSIEARASRLGVQPEALIYEQLLSNEGHGLLLFAAGNYAQGSLDPALAMMQFPGSVPGLGDGGAHSTIVCDASISTYLLSYWARDRIRGERVPLQKVVKWLTRDSAEAVCLLDRGLLKAGLKADINVINHRRLKLHAPWIVADLPGGGKRMVQDVDGYVATIVSGSLVRRHDQETANLPGRLVRGAQTPGSLQ